MKRLHGESKEAEVRLILRPLVIYQRHKQSTRGDVGETLLVVLRALVIAGIRRHE